MKARNEDDRARPRLTARIALLLGVFSFVVVVFIVAIVELVARAVSRRGPSAEEIEFVRDAAAQLAPCDAAARLGPRGSGGLRIAVLGESSGQYLGEALARRQGGGDLRLANCGRLGAALEHVERRFDEALAAEPDAIVIVFGHNLLFQHITTPVGLRMAELRQHLRILNLRSKPIDPTVRARDPAARLLAFERFLRRAAEDSRRRGVRLVVATLTPNLWLPPFPMPEREPLLAPPRIARLAGDQEGATRRLDALAAAHPDDAAIAFERGAWRSMEKDHAAAREHLRRAADLDPRADRALAATNALLRRVAAEEKLVLLDTERARAEASSDGTTGWESLEDNCHLYADLFDDEAGRTLALLGRPAHPGSIVSRPSRLRRVHELLAAAIEKHGATLAGRGDEHALALAYHRLLSELGASAQADLDDVILHLDDPPAPDRAPPSPAVRALLLRGAAGGAWDAGLRDRARAWNDRARALGDARAQAAAWVQRGRFALAEGNREEAASSYTRAIELDADNIEARAALEFLRPRR